MGAEALSRVTREAALSPRWTRHLWGAGSVDASAEDMASYLAACLSPPDSAIGRAIRVAQQPHYAIDPLRSAGLGWVLGPPGYLGHDGGTSGCQEMPGPRVRQLSDRGHGTEAPCGGARIRPDRAAAAAC
jgi:hypothetical protein